MSTNYSTFWGVGGQPKSGLDCLIVSIFISHTIRHASTRTHTHTQWPLPTQQTHETNIHAVDGIRTSDPNNEAGLDRTATEIGPVLGYRFKIRLTGITETR